MSEAGFENALAVTTYMPAMSVTQVSERIAALTQFKASILKENIDYGIIPGTDKPTLLKPGAEKLCTFFGLAVDLKVADKLEDWGSGLFYYRYSCSIFRDGVPIASAEGSANSKEKKYRWRTVFANQATDEDKRVGRPETRHSKKGGRPYDVYVIENTEPFDLINTLQKMAQKRAHIAATLIAVNASQFFTQDVEDLPQFAHEPGDATPASDVEAAIAEERAGNGAVGGTGSGADYIVHFGKNKGVRLGDCDNGYVKWLREKWEAKPYNGRISTNDAALQQALKDMQLATAADNLAAPAFDQQFDAPPPNDDDDPGF